MARRTKTKTSVPHVSMPKVVVRKATYLVLDLMSKTQALVEGPFKNTFDTLEDAEAYAGTVAEQHGGRLHIVQLLSVVTKTKGSFQSVRVKDDSIDS